MALRSKRGDPAFLPEITVAQLAEHKTGEVWVAVHGYVVKPGDRWYFGSHKGRDVTSRVLMQFHGIPLDDYDDGQVLAWKQPGRQRLL